MTVTEGFCNMTRSDMCESIQGLYRLSSEVDVRKLMFLHKLLSLPHACISNAIFCRKYLLYISNGQYVRTGFIPDICRLLNKYNLQFIVNDYFSSKNIPSKYEWKRIVHESVASKENDLWVHRPRV